MNIPTRREAETLLHEARELNPGPWVEHSHYAAQAAEAIARRCAGMDADAAFVLGCLHDIGRRAGVTGMRHIIDGYYFLLEKGYAEAARVCLTHSYPTGRAHAAQEDWDGRPTDLAFVKEYLARTEYDDYDKLIQLCDCLALPSGFCLIEKRLVDVTMRYGANRYSVPRWKAYFRLQAEFEQTMGVSIYSILPGVVENTFGISP
jgi:hypothetical protein